MNTLCSLENSFEKITQPGQNLVISGDFNCGDVDRDSSTVKPDAYDCAPNQKLVKSVTVVPGMSDHEGMTVIDTDIRPTYSRPKPRKINIFSKVNWDQIQKDTAKFRFDYLKKTYSKISQYKLDFI